MTLQEALKYATDGRSHADFTKAIAANLFDRTSPLVYADWLQENGQEGVADHIRKTVEDANQRDPKSRYYVVHTTHTGFFSQYPKPEGQPEGAPFIALSLPWTNKGKRMVGVHTVHAGSDGDYYFTFGRSLPISEAKEVVSKMGDLPYADKALASLTKMEQQ